MKKILLFFVSISILNSMPLSPGAIALMNNKPLCITQDMSKIRGNNNRVYGTIKINSSFDKGSFSAIGGEVYTSTNEFCTVSIPFDSLSSVQNVNGLLLFSPSKKVKPLMDSARVYGHVVDVHKTGGSPNGIYKGDGVVIGIIDGGFDYRHLAFQDNDGNCRIRRVWDQNGSGGAPLGYNYGVEYDTPQKIYDAHYSIQTSFSHGNHVASIAAGSDNETDYYGVAPNADLIFVATNFYDNGIVDGIRYIFDYADSIGKPAVINISLGSNYGPHDGYSSIDRVIEAFSGPGHIVVGAVGNERSDYSHLQASLNGYNEVKSFITIPSSSNQELVDIWGENAQNFEVRVAIYSTDGREVATSVAYSVEEIVNIQYVENTLSYGTVSLTYQLFGTKKSELNGKSEVIGQFSTNSQGLLDRNNYKVALIISGNKGEVNCWSNMGANDGYKDFYSDNISGFKDGDTTISISEVGGTGRATISVGAFTSKSGYDNVYGHRVPAFGKNVGEITSFSSMGPTVDGRVKPDITAPGDVIIAALRGDFLDYGSDSVLAQWGSYNQPPFYGGYSGTSMAAPFVTGVVALMLQANPNLTNKDVLAILRSSSELDNFTGNISGTGNNVWGWGKVNGDSAVALVLSDSLIENSVVSLKPRIRWGGDNLILKVSDKSQQVTISIFDIKGRIISTYDYLKGSSVTVPVTNLANGIYFYKIVVDGQNNFGEINIIK